MRCFFCIHLQQEKHMEELATVAHVHSEHALDESVRINLVAAFIKSGLTQKAFCTYHALKESTFKNWFYRYKSRVDALPTSIPAQESPVAMPPSGLFVPLHVEEDTTNRVQKAHSKPPISPPPICITRGTFHIRFQE